jgi:hypothetical protein
LEDFDRRADEIARDINDLVERGILNIDEGGGRSTSYSLAEDSPENSKRRRRWFITTRMLRAWWAFWQAGASGLAISFH